MNHPCLAKGFRSNETYEEIFESVCTKDYAADQAKVDMIMFYSPLLSTCHRYDGNDNY